MLATYLKNRPCTNCVVIQDKVTQKADKIVEFLIKQHLKESSVINYCQFEYRIQNEAWFNSVNVYSFFDDAEDKALLNFINLDLNNTVVVINSVGHLVFKYGLNKTYKILQKIKEKQPKQIISIVHSEIFSYYTTIFDYAKHLSSLYIKLEPKLMQNQDLRMSYIYKKDGGKVIKDIEQYLFLNEILVTKLVDKLDVKKLIQGGSSVLPETLTTFKISLNANEKEKRDQLHLPYLPKELGDDKESEGGNIFYKFDEADDWDEEDPDDDLDF